MKSVLILGGETRVTVPVARSLHRRGIPVTVAAHSPDTPRIASRAIRKFVSLPRYDHPRDKFFDDLIRLIQGQQCDMLIPADDTALSIVADYYERLKAAVHVSCPPAAVVRRVLDKTVTLRVAQQCGLRTPTTYLVEDARALDELKLTLRYPIVAKPRTKSNLATSQFKVRYFHSFKHLCDSFNTDPTFGRRNLLQTYCLGDGVGIGMLVHDGQALATFQHRRIKELPYTGGVSVLAISESPDPTLCKLAWKLLTALQWEGVAMVEFRYDRAERTATLMEVNGRYWGSVFCALQAGLDFPYYEWQLAHGEQPTIPSRYQVGLKVRWMTGDLVRLHALLIDQPPGSLTPPSRWIEVLKFLLDFRPSIRSAHWSFADPLPAILEWARTVRTLAQADAKRLVGSLIPNRVLTQIRISRSLGYRQGYVYLKLHTRRALGLKRNYPKTLPLRPRSILFVCHANIIRSPMAAALLKQCLGGKYNHGVRISSAGLYTRPNSSADARALVVAKDFGISLDDHRSQQLTPDSVERSDLIIVMDFLNEARLLARFPSARRKILLIGACSNDSTPSAVEVPDPYEGHIMDIRRAYEALKVHAQALTKTLFPEISMDASPRLR